MKSRIEIKAEANLTKTIDDINTNVIIPPTQEVSKGITKLLNVVTTFIDNATYRYIENSKYKKQQFLDNLAKKYEKIPETEIVDPDISILGNTMDFLKYNLDKDYIVDLYSNIMISDMDKRTKNIVHISFVEILKQLDKNDLKLLEAIYNMKSTKSIALAKLKIIDSNNKFIGYELHNTVYMADISNYFIDDYNSFSTSLENLDRLGLINISYIEYFIDNSIYDSLLKRLEPSAKHILDRIKTKDNDAKFGYEKGMLSITNLGLNLMKICLRDL